MSSATLERTLMQPPPQLPPERKRSAFAKLWLWLRNHLIQFLAAFALIFMFLPVVDRPDFLVQPTRRSFQLHLAGVQSKRLG